MRYGNCMNGYFGQGITHGMSYFGFGLHLFVGAIVIIIIALLFIAFVKKKNSASSSEADETLKLRYVNGAITEEEYQKMKKMIH